MSGILSGNMSGILVQSEGSEMKINQIIKHFNA